MPRRRARAEAVRRTKRILAPPPSSADCQPRGTTAGFWSGGPSQWQNDQSTQSLSSVYEALDLFRVTAARTRVLNAFSSTFSPSWKSMARLVFPSRLELKRPEGSFRAAPLAKVNFTTAL